MNFIIWLIVGGIIGWLASMIMRTDAQQGVVLNVVVGIIGALLGGWLISPLVGVPTINQDAFSPAGDAGFARRRGDPAGDRQPVPPRPRPLTGRSPGGELSARPSCS